MIDRAGAASEAPLGTLGTLIFHLKIVVRATLLPIVAWDIVLLGEVRGGEVAAFQLTANPFWLLRTSPRAKREDIVEAFEDAVAAGETSESELLRAQQIILAPKTRLDAELAWLPELAPTRAREVATALSPKLTMAEARILLDGVEGLAKANLAADLCGRFGGEIGFATALIDSYRTVAPESIESTINAARAVAGVPKVNGEMLATALVSIEAAHAKAMVGSLASGPRPGAALRRLLEAAGEVAATRTLVEMVAREYGAWAEVPLRTIGDEIRRHAADLRERPQSVDEIAGIEKALGSWAEVIGPILDLDREKGLDEPRSKALHGELRDLCLWLVNDENMVGLALDITKSMQAAFADLPSVSSQLQDDISTLSRIASEADVAERMAPLLAVAQEIRSDLKALDSGLLRAQFGPSATGLAKRLFEAFVSAVDATTAEDAVLPWTIVRSLAIELNNDTKAEEAAYEIIRGLLSFRGGPSDSELRAKLEDDERTISTNLTWNEINRLVQRGKLEQGMEMLNALLARTPQGTDNWQSLTDFRQNLATGIDAARRKKVMNRVKLGGWGAFIAFIVYASNSEKSPSEHQPAHSTSSTAYSYSPPPPPLETPGEVDTGAEVQPAYGVSDPKLSKMQLRWCIFQGARIDNARDMVFTDVQVSTFNAAVAHYNGRCKKFHYREADMTAIQAELAQRPGAIRNEAQLLVSGGR